MGLFSNLVFCLSFFFQKIKKKIVFKKEDKEEGVLILKSNAKHYTTFSLISAFIRSFSLSRKHNAF